jgi:hypothetical protein
MGKESTVGKSGERDPEWMREELFEKMARGLRKSYKDRQDYHCETSNKGRSMN